MTKYKAYANIIYIKQKTKMPEKYPSGQNTLLTPEIDSGTVSVEGISETVERLKDVPIIADTPGGIDRQSLSLYYERDEEGWRLAYGPKADDVNLRPENEADAMLLVEAINELKGDVETKERIASHLQWWRRLPSDLRETVESGTKDGLLVKNPESDDALEVLNISDQELSFEEQEEITQCLQNIANFTGNKVFERVNGIVLADSSHFDERVLGGHYTYGGGVITINLQELRKISEDRANKYNKRYEKYFENPQSPLAITIAHEVGHAMDIINVDEAEKYGVKNISEKITNAFGGITGDFSIFDDRLGWDGGGLKRDEKDVWTRDWRIDPAQEIELREESPTDYGKKDPKEDFAETFAILSLGGKRSFMPNRLQVLAEGLERIHEADLHGPFVLKGEKINKGDTLRARLPSQIAIKGLVKGSVLASR